MTGTSVVIAARNPGQLLFETLASVASQTRPPSSVVVVDDGSTDGSVTPAVASFPFVTLITQQPMGRSAARNRGAATTTSAHLVFLDADDLLRPTALEVLETAIESDPMVELVHARMIEFIDQRDDTALAVRAPLSDVRTRLGGATLLRRSLWNRVGPMDERIPRGEWIDWISRATDCGAHVVDIDDVVLLRRIHAANSSGADDTDAHYLTVIRQALRRKQQGSRP